MSGGMAQSTSTTQSGRQVRPKGFSPQRRGDRRKAKGKGVHHRGHREHRENRVRKTFTTEGATPNNVGVNADHRECVSVRLVSCVIKISCFGRSEERRVGKEG